MRQPHENRASLGIRLAGAAALALACAAAAWELAPPPAPLERGRALAVRQRFLTGEVPTARRDLRDLGAVLERTELHEAARLLPQTSRHDGAALTRLYRFAETCDAALAGAAPAPESLAKAWVWHAHRCDPARRPLPPDFFAKPPYIHPGGGSFVAHAARSGLAGFDAAWLRQHAAEAHLGEWRGLAAQLGAAAVPPALAPFAKLSPRAAEKVAQGAPIVRGSDVVLLRRASTEDGVGPPVYLEYPLARWERATDGDALPRRVAAAALAGLGGLAAAALAGIYGGRVLRRARETRERRLIMQTLAHEIRTPITGLQLALEPLRRAFDTLSAPQQESVLAIGGETARLTRLVETTQAYLQAFTQKGVLERRAVAAPSVHELVESVVEQAAARHASRGDGADAPTIAIERDAPDGPLGVDPFWLALCLRNLVDNAFLHGKPPVIVRIGESARGRRLALSVRDGGELPATRRLLARWTRPFAKGEGSAGFGLGLYLVRTVMGRLGGRLEMTRAPATFTLILGRSAPRPPRAAPEPPP